MAYELIRVEAQAKANRMGMDYGIENLPPITGWRYFLLPRRESRSGHELRCEIMSPENIAKTRPGHGHA